VTVTTLDAQVMNPFIGNSPKNIPTDFGIPLWGAIVEKYEKRVTPVSNLIKQGSDPYDQNKIRVLQRYHPFFVTQVKATTANNSQNIDLDSVTGLRVGDLLEIIDYYGGVTATLGSDYGLDYSTREVVRVESITDSDTIVATRDMDETTTSNWPVHPIDSYVRRVSRASPDNTTFANAPVYRGDFLFNYPQLFESALQTTIKARNTASYESKNYWLDDIEAVIDELKWARENAFIAGRRMAGDETSTPTKPFTMGGILWWLEQNSSGSSTGNVVDLNGRQANVWDIDDILRYSFKNHRKGPATHLLAHPDTAAIWDMVIHPYRQATMGDSKISLKTDEIETRWGSIEVVETINMPNGVMAFIDPSDWEWNHYKGMNWDVVKQTPKETFKAVDSWAMFGEFSIICKDLHRQLLITDINTDLNQYPGRSFLR
jgi:hypothetical protein